jgi:bis(5'-nucleosyl)-tetraphosphatase (symmetrical)
MGTYAIGDVQGCYDELQALLHHIAFNPHKDTLWFAGDLVNRGPKSLEVLRFIRDLPAAKVVLGNHDIHLLSLANGHPHPEHTLHAVIAAPDCTALIDWLRQQPLLHYDADLGYLMTHAGVLPQWTLAQAQTYAHEVENLLQQDDYADHLHHLYGNEPNQWREDLSGYDRWRFITNAFTRMRFCTLEGHLDFMHTGKVGSQPNTLHAWFDVPHRALGDIPIIFGHWAALEGKTNAKNVFEVDTGCAWGGSLTAMRLEDRQLFSVPSQMQASGEFYRAAAT